ncbi:serine-rich adhesin for platelets [Wyeomyia smithii]|uniref:serine-rich adhesin for platelets n=1 Tax=Wyeomyia smithii TaxID=174621 RepID=UPI002467C75E|nr:serine-rich adhesin for platelets [Wyeomyia smithii]
MEFKILNVSAVRTLPTVSQFTTVGRGHVYGASFETFPGEKFIRGLPYRIPAVSHHYGNAFAPDGDEEEDTEEEACTQQLILQQQFGDAGDDEYYYEEEGEVDVEMSPAVEVISIDPNCDYDSEEGSDSDRGQKSTVNQRGFVIEHSLDQSSVAGETVVEDVHAHDDVETALIKALESGDIEPELENLHRDSDGEDSDASSSSDSTSTTSSLSDSSDSSSDSSRSSSDSGSNGSSRSNRKSVSISTVRSSLDVRHGNQEDGSVKQNENLQRILERRKLMLKERVKRRNSTNRKSFSLPHSPIRPVDSIGWPHDVTSLSFEDFDMSAIVKDLSPLKVPVHGCVSDDKLIEEMAKNNYDLASYITESNPSPVKPVSPPKSSQKKQKSRGKQIKTLRELMISPKPSTCDLGAARRSCTSKARRIVENSDSETEQSEVEEDSKDRGKIFGIEQLPSKSKRKEDDIKADPTWNPGCIGSGKPVQRTTVHAPKITALPTSATVDDALPTKLDTIDSKPQSIPVKSSESTKQVSSSNNKIKTLSAGSQLARNKVLSLMSKGKLLKRPVNQKAISGIKTKSNHSSKTEIPRSIEHTTKKPQITSNVKLDHDYCSPKRKSTASSSASGASQRKAIEIPFLLPTIDQLKQKKIQSKSLNKQSQKVDKKSKQTGKNCDKSCQSTETVDKCPVVKSEQIAEKVPDHTNALKPQTVPLNPPKQVSLLKVNQNKGNVEQNSESTNLPLAENVKPDTFPINVQPTSTKTETPVKTKKKLNLQEYKKRREIPTEESVLPAVVPAGSSSTISSSSCVSTISISSSNEELRLTMDLLGGTDEQQSVHMTARNLAPLDPISAAKLKALRMQQLKKEAAIKSTEAKIIPKTVPTIVPLAEITSIKFDDHGNPIHYDKNAQQSKTEAKWHEDYEEIIIVSMGCNTDLTIDPRKTKQETVRIKNASTELPEKSIAKSELLSNITDTIKRCQSSGPTIISSSSLISSIHEMVIKKKSSDKLTIGGGQANLQGSPNIGGSPTNSFSPGKPEKAGGSYDQKSPSFDYDETQLRQTVPTAKQKPIEHGEDKIIMHLRKDRQRVQGVSVAIQTLPLEQFSELKTLSPLKHQERQRTTSRNSCGSIRRSRSRQPDERDRSRRVYRRRRSRSSSCETEIRNRSVNSYRNESKHCSSRRSRSRCSSAWRKSRSCSRSRYCSKRSRSRSYRCRESVSSERHSRHRRRDRCRRDRKGRRQTSRSDSSSFSDSSRSSYSRSRSRSTRSRSSSRSCSRVRAMQQQRNEYRRPAAVSPERKIVYVGRLEPELKRDDLKRKFMQFGRIKQVTVHYKESGAKYGFVTFEKPQDAYKAIDASGSNPNLCGYDVSFGGRRAFCRTEYADLDGDLSLDQEPIPYLAPDGSLLLTPNPLSVLPRKDEPETFEDMLKKLKKEISAKKPRKS